jgi:ribonuclease BN (tRNA processing enzyme)
LIALAIVDHFPISKTIAQTGPLANGATAAKVRTFVLVHITEQVEQPGVRERVLHEATAIFDGHIIFGQDLLEVPLEATEVPKIR